MKIKYLDSPLLQISDDLILLIKNADEEGVIYILNKLSINELTVMLPSYTNTNEYSYPLTFWAIWYERKTLLDYLVKRLSTCILHSRGKEQPMDALTFSIKMNKHKMTDHLLINYSWSFNLLRPSIFGSKPHICEQFIISLSKHSVQASYIDLLEYAHHIDKMFSNDVQDRDYDRNKANLAEKTRLQVNSQKIRILLTYKGLGSSYAPEIAKFINFAVIQ